MSTNREIIARCHCGAFSLTTTLPLSTLPQSHTYCHCESCRRRSGHLVLKPLGLGDYQPTESDLQPLASYSTCLGVNPVTTYFCRTCGSKVFIKVLSRSKTRSRWAMPLGVVADPKGLVEMKGHSWVGDTKDGGVTEMMNDGLPRYKEESGELFEPPTSPATTSDYLHLHCSCNGFSAYLSRPTPTLPLPKGCYWYFGPQDVQGKPTRYMASWCACDSCRLVTGSSMPAHPWIAAVLKEMFIKDAQTGKMKPFIDIISGREAGQAIPSGPDDSTPPAIGLDTQIPGLTLYHSSPSVSRYHCSTCGASVFYYSPERPFLITIPAGLADSEDGALAESWLRWWTGPEEINPAIEQYEDAEKRDAEAAKRFKEGVIEWGKKKGLMKWEA